VPDLTYPAISAPTAEPAALLKTVEQLREAVELLTGQRAKQYSVTDKLLNVQRQVAGTSARLTEEVNVVSDGISALSSLVTTIEALANDATAFGEIRFEAKAAPGGASVSYGLHINAGNKFAGFEVIVDSGSGVAAINLLAERLRMSDTGTSEPVFDYSAGKFRFFVPVEVQTEDIGFNQVSQILAARSAIGGKVRDLSITVRNGSSILVQGDYTGATYSKTVGMAFGALVLTNGLGGGGSLIQTAQNNWVRDGGGNHWINQSAIVGPQVGPLTAGTYDFSVQSQDNYTDGVSGGTVGIILMELAR
jgi:hypothetical protein